MSQFLGRRRSLLLLLIRIICMLHKEPILAFRDAFRRILHLYSALFLVHILNTRRKEFHRKHRSRLSPCIRSCSSIQMVCQGFIASHFLRCIHSRLSLCPSDGAYLRLYCTRYMCLRHHMPDSFQCMGSTVDKSLSLCQGKTQLYIVHSRLLSHCSQHNARRRKSHIGQLTCLQLQV